MQTWQLWTAGEVLREVKGIEPLLASWEKSIHPAQVRLRVYLERLMSVLKPLPPVQKGLFLHLEVDVHESDRLLHYYDLENYLTPLFGRRWLDSSHFVFVSATKRVGGGSHFFLGFAKPVEELGVMDGWGHFSCSAGSGTGEKQWKAGLKADLAASKPQLLPPGPVEVHLAWRCSPMRNWVNLWKPTGDAMGPVLGESVQRGFNPKDDRIVSLGLHLNVDRRAGYSVDVGMWWRPAGVARE